MNSVVNDAVRRFTPFRRVYDAGDAGGVRAAGVEFIDESVLQSTEGVPMN
jgi:hypothetical protein